MSEIIRIEDFSDPRLDLFVRLTGAQLRSSIESERGVFIAESLTVIEVALDSGCEPIALLTDERLINGSVEKIIERCEGVPIYTAKKEVLEKLTGFALTRGALCAMQRPKMPTLNELLKDAKTVAVLENIADSTNIGAIFRSAAALGMDGVLLTPTSCDPLNRRAVRVSMGSVFLVPWTWLEAPIPSLHEHGFRTAAMALSDNSVSIDHPALKEEEKLAIILGTEGDGLSHQVIEEADYVVRIPMSHEVDSLNVAAASAVAFWELRAK